MCYKCCNTLLIELLALITDYKDNKSYICLAMIIGALELLQTKMVETLSISVRSGIDYVSRVREHHLLGVLSLLEEIDINKTIIDNTLFEMYTEHIN